ncbi:MAG: quinolinate synthase NadA [bacterium]
MDTNHRDSLSQRIRELKKKRNAVILAHNYQIPEVQDVADYVGDSFGLSRTASATDTDVIVFCGVLFMAETASILSPTKKVLMPEPKAGCPMADMITREQLIELKRKHPKAVAVGYVNTTAAVKAELDLCCTSGNAVKVVEALKDAPEIIFVPDKHLANYVSLKTGRKFIAWEGYCPSHVSILAEDIQRAKKQHPKAKVVVHPECTSAVCELADEVVSTEGMCRYAKESSVDEIIVGTEVGIIHRLKKENPGKKFYSASDKATCPNMKLTTLEKILWCLEDMKYEVSVSEEIRLKAHKAVNKMIEIS